MSARFVGVLVALGLGAVGCDQATGGGEMAILDVQPQKGTTSGEAAVQIFGENFRQDIGYTIYFGTQKAGSVTLLNPETILVTTPSHVAPGQVDITVRADDGHAFKIPGVFTFRDAATGPEVDPTKGNLKF